MIEILGGIVTSTPEASALFAPGGRLLGAGETLRQPKLADALERLAADGAAPFYTGDIAAAITEWVWRAGGLLTASRPGSPTGSSTASLCTSATADATCSPTRRRRRAGC